MCGRFVSAGDPQRVADFFGVLDPVVAAEPLGPNFNVAPTQDVLGVVTGRDGVTRVQAFHWGLIPSWAKDRKIASRMINARAETLNEKPAFKALFAKKRCLIPMEGFYEWRAGSPDGPLNAKGQPVKQPLFIHRSDDAPLAAAGLWTAWKDPDDPEQRWLESATIVTTGANDTMRAVHDRMPVFVPTDRWADWLDPANTDPLTLVDLFAPHDDARLTMRPVSTDVNNVRHNGAHLLDPL